MPSSCFPMADCSAQGDLSEYLLTAALTSFFLNASHEYSVVLVLLGFQDLQQGDFQSYGGEPSIVSTTGCTNKYGNFVFRHKVLELEAEPQGLTSCNLKSCFGR